MRIINANVNIRGLNTYNLLLLFKLYYLCIELLQPLLKILLVLQDGNLVLFLDSQLHLSNLQCLLKFSALG